MIIASVEECLERLTNRDLEALMSIYNHRCLTIQMIYELNYMRSYRGDKEEIVSDSYCKKKVAEFEELGIVEVVERLKGDVYFLTRRGVDLLREYFDMPTNIYDSDRGVVKRGYYTAGELKISPKYFNHQLSLNQFMIDFVNRDIDVSWKYYDEKHISEFRTIRPDGLLNVLDTDFFLEIDMATESKNQLYEKWENYRRFLVSSEYDHIDRKIVVFFIVDNTASPQARIDLVKHTLGERLMDKISNNFEVFIGEREDILDILEEKIKASNDGDTIDNTILKTVARQGFSVAFGEKLNKIFNDVSYDFYCRKINEDNIVVEENGKLQEYLMDSYKYEPFTVMKKISFLSVNNVYYQEKLNRKLTYVVVGMSEEVLYRDLKILDILLVDNVFYTTFDRLQSREFHDALFQFDYMGNVHTFKNNGLEDRRFEFNIIEKMEEQKKKAVVK